MVVLLAIVGVVLYVALGMFIISMHAAWECRKRDWLVTRNNMRRALRYMDDMEVMGIAIGWPVALVVFGFVWLYRAIERGVMSLWGG